MGLGITVSHSGGIQRRGAKCHSSKGQNKERPKTSQTSVKPKGISEIYNEKCSNLAGITTHRESILLIQKEPQRPLWNFKQNITNSIGITKLCAEKNVVRTMFSPLSLYFKGPTIQASCWMRRFSFELPNLGGSMKTFVVEENCSLVNVDGF